MNAILIRLRTVARTPRLTDSVYRQNPLPRWWLAILATSLSAGVLMAAVVPGLMVASHSEPNAPAITTQVPSAQPMRLYELPPIFVEADRQAELAKIDRERQFDPIRHARSRLPLKPPA